MLSLLHGYCPFKILLFKFVYPLPTPQFGLKNGFSLHVGLIQLCNMLPAAQQLGPPHPPLGGVWGGSKYLEGGLGGGGMCPSFNIPTICPILDFPYTLSP